MNEDSMEQELSLMKAGKFNSDFRKALERTAEGYCDLWREILKRTKGFINIKIYIFLRY